MARVGPKRWLTGDVGGAHGDASARARGQLDRLVDNQEQTAALVEALGDDNEPESSETSGRQLRAMTPPQHDDSQITAMADARARLTREDRPEPGWWQKLAGRLRPRRQ